MHNSSAMGIAIGLNANSQYEDTQAQLEPGDTIIYYTNGFTNAASPSGARFDEENFIASFSVAIVILNDS
ncbi:SpoIIE family protein phosphatase [Tolypothrix sp. FACHB-123]|nr:SpoIIE family protein phosphatase [Tolypothrix sp. FACHB-123]